MESILNYGMEIAFGLITTALTAAFAQLNYKIKQRMQKHDALEAGMQAILRDRIIHVYHHYMEKGWLPIYARENVECMYNAYHDLGGNGTITGLYEELIKLPFKEAGIEDVV